MRIGEVARAAGVATSAVRFYEAAGLLPEPPRASNGYRDYDPAVVERIAFIRTGQSVGLTLGDLRDVLAIRDGGEAPCSHVRALLDRRLAELDERVRELRRLRLQLAGLASTAAAVDPADCPPESICRIIAGGE